MDGFLNDFGPAGYHSAADYEKAVGKPMPSVVIGGEQTGMNGSKKVKQAVLETDPGAEAALLKPRREALAAYEATLDRLHLDGYVYPAIQMPPVDETMPQDGNITGGPHSDTAFINMLGAPAISIPAGFYDDGLPFGIEFSARRWRDGDLISWAYDYEQHTHHRRRPVLVEGGMLPKATKPLEP